MNAKIDISDVTIKTERLTLRPWTWDDLDDFYEYARVPGVGEMAGWPAHTSPDVSKAVLGNFIEGKRTFAIELNGKVVGSLGIECYEEKDAIEYARLQCRELGFVIAKECWGQGLMPEAVNAVLHWLFCDKGLDAVFCGHFIRNLRSSRVQEKCGFIPYKTGIYETLMGTKEPNQMRVLERRHWEEMHSGELSAEDKKILLYLRQKRTLLDFLDRGAITPEQFDKSFGDLTEKMGMERFCRI